MIDPVLSLPRALAYPMVRGGGLFLMLIGAGLIGAIAFSGDALVNYTVFFVGVGVATISLFAARRLSRGSPTRLQIAALIFAISLEVILFAVMGRTLPRGTAEHVRWLWVSMIVGIHFLPMALCFGPGMLLLGGACVANAMMGLLLPYLPYEIFGLLDGCLKVGFGIWMFVPKARGPERPDYGIDAPKVIRNLFLFGGIGVLVWGSLTASALSGRYHIPISVVRCAGIGFGYGISFILMAVWLLWEGKVGKMRHRDHLLQKIAWTGREQVLDVGCGRGLMLIGAAKRLTSGLATGIDIWQAEDLTGNRAESTLENARREGVAERVEVQSADMRQMPFADNSFDVVVSRAAIHNIYNAGDRAQAIREIARVLKPGGQVVIDDIRHLREYSSVFAENGCRDIQRFGSRILSALLMLITFGSLRPGTIVVRKSSAHG